MMRLCGTPAQFEAYWFGERMIFTQEIMIRRTDAIIREIYRRRVSGESWEALAIAGKRQAEDYCQRQTIMQRHRDVLVAVAEKHRAVIQ